MSTSRPPARTTTATALVRDLLELRPTPNAGQLRDRLAPYATEISTASRGEWPSWARESANGYIYLTCGGDVRGVIVWDDPRGWGTYAKIVVAAATLADIEKAVGPTHEVPRNPDDTISGDTVAALLEVDGRTRRVFVEHRGGAVASILMDLGKP
jgi:hypothetical protein